MKNLKVFFPALVALCVVAGCASLPEKHGMISPEEKVLSRIDNLSARPDWLIETQPFRIVNGEVVSLGAATVPGDSRVEAAYRISANNAKANVAGAIEQRLSFVFQNAEEGVKMDATQARYIGAEASALTSSSMRTSKQYWEKIFAVDEHGVGNTFYRVYSVVSMPESEFKRAIGDAIRKQSGTGKLSKDFASKVNDHWNKFVDGDKPREAASE